MFDSPGFDGLVSHAIHPVSWKLGISTPLLTLFECKKTDDPKRSGVLYPSIGEGSGDILAIALQDKGRSERENRIKPKISLGRRLYPHGLSVSHVTNLITGLPDTASKPPMPFMSRLKCCMSATAWLAEFPRLPAKFPNKE